MGKLENAFQHTATFSTSIPLQAVELNLCNTVNLVSSLRVYVASLRDDFEKFDSNAKGSNSNCVPNLQSGHKKAQKKEKQIDESIEPDYVDIC